MSTAREPYLSFVAAARNDNHGGNLLPRMQAFVNGLAAQCERHRLPAELVLVDWNPPADRPNLSEALEWPSSGDGFFTVRVVEVPHELHSTIRYADQLPLFQMIAKNVGIRRAHGAFVVATTIDLLFPDELMSFLAQRELDPHVLYRTDRYDVEFDVDPTAPIDELLAASESSVIRIYGLIGTLDKRTDEFFQIVPEEKVALVEARQGGQSGVQREAARTNGRERPGAVRRAASVVRGRLRGAQAAASAETPAEDAARDRWPRALDAFVPLHTNACGDFTLLSREAWAELRGYPELHMFSMFLDSLLLYQAHYVGFREEIVAAPVYHLEHDAGWKPDTESLNSLNERLERAAVPQITYEQFLDWTIEMHTKGAPIDWNDDTWGFSEHRLLERVFAPVTATVEESSE